MQRVLIVDAQAASCRLLADLLRDVCNCQIWTAPDQARALTVALTSEPYMIFVDHGPAFDGLAFTRTLRRSDLACRKAPVIMLASEATAAVILGARDAGVHEFLRKPFTIRDLSRRLEAVATRPRDWVEGVGYVGPDRRRFNSGDYSGPLKRRVDHAETPDEARVHQALRILKAALGAIETDPRQALRAMLAQAMILRDSPRVRADPALLAAVATFGQHLSRLDPTTLRRAQLEGLIGPLIATLPADAPGARRSAA
jgi:CheY-like chemotaxis protein